MTTKQSSLGPKSFKKLKKINGVSVASTYCGLKKNKKDDLVLITFSQPGKIYGVFTKSNTPGEPIIWNKSIINKAKVSAILINSGNANVFNGKKGKISVEKILKKLSKEMRIDPSEIYLASTGVIGEPLEYSKIISKIPSLIQKLNNKSESWIKAANAIRTTDTYPKYHSEKIQIKKNKQIFINGLAKGSGMIAPNMATMLAFISTDIKISKPILQKILEEVNEETFNAITVDGDTSTSDTVIISATGMAENKIIKSKKDKHYEKFKSALYTISKDLALQIVRDGEGASKLISVRVAGTKNKKISKKIAFSIANSPLVKTAISAEDANWGRIIMAIGKTREIFNNKKLKIYLGKYLITSNGKRHDSYSENKVSKYMKNSEIEIYVEFGSKRNEASVWTCDLTHKYIDINGSYRS